MSPFDQYPGGGYQLQGVPQVGDNRVRHGYGPPVFRCCGWSCAYCGRNLRDTYESWLDIQVDHVVPWNAGDLAVPIEWLGDLTNQVTCCAACNAFLNGFRVKEPVPSVSDFFGLRDQMFLAKKEHAARRHEQEREFWTRNVAK